MSFSPDGPAPFKPLTLSVWITHQGSPSRLSLGKWGGNMTGRDVPLSIHHLQMGKREEQHDAGVPTEAARIPSVNLGQSLATRERRECARLVTKTAKGSTIRWDFNARQGRLRSTECTRCDTGGRVLFKQYANLPIAL